MEIQQKNKRKLQPVLDFHELNHYVYSHIALNNVCNETMRKWRKIGNKFAMLDLRSAYMQIHIDPTLWKHQAIIYKKA